VDTGSSGLELSPEMERKLSKSKYSWIVPVPNHRNEGNNPNLQNVSKMLIFGPHLIFKTSTAS
jgi:hypothetical protein